MVSWSTGGMVASPVGPAVVSTGWTVSSGGGLFGELTSTFGFFSLGSCKGAVNKTCNIAR